MGLSYTAVFSMKCLKDLLVRSTVYILSHQLSSFYCGPDFASFIRANALAVSGRMTESDSAWLAFFYPALDSLAGLFSIAEPNKTPKAVRECAVVIERHHSTLQCPDLRFDCFFALKDPVLVADFTYIAEHMLFGTCA